MNRTRFRFLLTLVAAFTLGAGSALADEKPASSAPLPSSPFAQGSMGESSDQTSPAWFGQVREGKATRPDAQHRIFLKGRHSLSAERAAEDARRQLKAAVGEWLAPDVPTDWKAPEALLDSLIVARHQEVVRLENTELGLDASLPAPDALYVTGYMAELSPERRADFVTTYEREQGDRRMGYAAGGLGLILTFLAILVGYIRADEATRGYYTNRLRLVAAAAAGAAGAVAYRMLV